MIILLNNDHIQYSITEDKIEDIHNDASNKEDDGPILKEWNRPIKRLKSRFMNKLLLFDYYFIDVIIYYIHYSFIIDNCNFMCFRIID